MARSFPVLMQYLGWDYIDMSKELRMWLYRYVEGTITNGIRSSGMLHDVGWQLLFPRKLFIRKLKIYMSLRNDG